MYIGSTNLLSKKYLDNVSISLAITKALTNISDTEDSLEEENNLLKKLCKEPDTVIKKVIASATYLRNYKSVSGDMLSKIW